MNFFRRFRRGISFVIARLPLFLYSPLFLLLVIWKFIGDAIYTKKFVPKLKDKEASVRANAAYKLGIVGNRKAIQPLIETLKDNESKVRTEAAWALGHIGYPFRHLGNPRAIKPLIEALN